jgi:hypothetical protein
MNYCESCGDNFPECGCYEEAAKEIVVCEENILNESEQVNSVENNVCLK